MELGPLGYQSQILELPPEGIVGSEVDSAEGLVHDIGSGIFTTIFSIPSFVCAFICLSSLWSTTLKFHNLRTSFPQISSSVDLTATSYANDTQLTP